MDRRDIDQLIRAFDARNLYDCERVLEDPEEVERGHTMYLRARGAAVTPFYPGPMQLRHVVADGTDNVVIRFSASVDEEQPPENPVGIAVLLKRADEPINFEYTLTAVDKNPDGSTKGSVREVVQVTGDWDHSLAAYNLGGSDNELILRGFRPGEVVHVAFANLKTSEQTASGASIVSLPPEFLDQGVVHIDLSHDGGESSGSGGLTEAEVRTGDPTASCACDGTGGSPVGLGVGLVLLGRRRRRR